MTQQEVRSYEVSVWTLQDDFITVLKPANIEFKGQIQDGSLELNVDGTQEFSFTIPMYLNVDGIKKENPIWYDYRDGVLLVNMRKIKVILNKGTEDEEVFEYIITKVTERHEKDELYCDVECEGLAFSELGKQGYKISLVSDDFYDEDLKWFNKTTDVSGNILVPNEPHATLQYWLNKFLKPWPTNNGPVSPAIWYYVVDMDWGAYTVMAKRDKNSQEVINVAREKDKVYEEEYVVSWELTNDGLIPGDIEGYKEKERLVDLEESNIYNLTQDLAETFGIYCKYIYEHDENYRITARKIVFYNSFIEEGKGPIDINYKYNTTSISREMDGTDIVTKMYVRPVDSDVSASGLITIMDVGANKSLEDYVLNFDYLYSIGAIDEERYNYVSTYERKMRQWNQELIPKGERLTALAVMLPEEEAKLATAETAVVLDKERRDKANQLYNSLVNDEGVIQVTNANPKQMYLYQEESDQSGKDKFYISFTEKGVIKGTVKIYRDIEYDINDNDGYSLVEPITTGTSVEDDFNNLVRISNIYFSSDDATRKNFVYVTYDYQPRLYYENVCRVWEQRVVKDEAELARAKVAVEAIKLEISDLESDQKQLIAEKEEEIENFQRMMGPALREGYWQPDDYTDYGDTHTDSFSSSAITLNTASGGRQDFVVKGTTDFDFFIWDNGLFDDEQKLYYELGANQQRQYYYFVDLTEKMNSFRKNKDNDPNNFFYDLSNISFAFFDFVYGTPETTNKVPNIANLRKFTINSECFPVFVQNGYKVKFGLLLTGAEKLSATELNCMLNSNKNDAKVARYTHTVNGNDVVYNEDILVGNAQPIPLSEAYRIVYPRIMVKSLSMKTSTDQFSLNLDGNELKVYEDYYILTKLEDNEEILYGSNNVSLKPDKDSYYITIKPESFIKYSTEAAKYATGKIGGTLDVLFTISNADTAIYLDAVEVLKESSQPQVSYNLNVGLVQKDYIKTVYKMLNRIVHINDPELKFKNVQGYVSKVVLDLDRPWEDSIESKNYKTKFEDLFTKIIASTEQMKKSSYVSGIVSQAFTSTGELKPTVVQASIDKSNVNYAFNSGKLTIDQSNGILATSSEGVIALRGGGLFSATEKDEDGNWKWQSILTPAGLNTSALAAGQLDTNNLRLFAGDDLRFQMNSNGIFAYKNWKSDFDLFDASTPVTVKQDWAAYGQREDVGFEADPAQYVTLNEDGLFLIADEGALILNKEGTDYIQITERVERVAITWNGLTLRNYDNEEVFYADADTGDLNITGNITATGLNIVTKNPDDGSDIELDFDDFFEDYESNIEDFNDSLEQLGYDLFGNGGTASNPTSGGALYKLNSKTQLLQDNGHISMRALGYITSTNHGTESVETILARTANIQVNANGEISIESNEYIKNGSNNFELGSSSGIHLTPTSINIGTSGSLELTAGSEINVSGGLVALRYQGTWTMGGITVGASSADQQSAYTHIYNGGYYEDGEYNGCGIEFKPSGILQLYSRSNGIHNPDITAGKPSQDQTEEGDNEGTASANTIDLGEASTNSKDNVIWLDAPYIIIRGSGSSTNRMIRLVASAGEPKARSTIEEYGVIWFDFPTKKSWQTCPVKFKRW